MNQSNIFSKLFLKKDVYPDDILKQINIYSITDSTRVIGSYSYRSGNTGDIDLLEEIHNNNKYILINIFVDGIKKVVNNIESLPNNYFGEVKLGLDHLYYDLYIGICRNNVYTLHDNFFELMELYFDKGFINQDEHTKILEIKNKNNRNQKDYEIIRSIVRHRYILRWTVKEIMKGYKTLVNFSGKYKYSIDDAVKEKSKINVEGIFLRSYSIYSDCSNYFVLTYTTKYNNKAYLNANIDPNVNLDEQIKDDLKKSIYELLYSKIQSNLFKACKRILSYGIHFKDIDLVTKAYKVINSPYGKMYVLISQLKTLSKLLKIHDNKYIDMNIVFNQIQNIIFELKNLINVECDKIHTNDNKFSFRQIVENLQFNIDSFTIEQKLSKNLDDRAHELFIILNNDVQDLMIDNKLYPIPSNLIPKSKPF